MKCEEEASTRHSVEVVPAFPPHIAALLGQFAQKLARMHSVHSGSPTGVACPAGCTNRSELWTRDTSRPRQYPKARTT